MWGQTGDENRQSVLWINYDTLWFSAPASETMTEKSSNGSNKQKRHSPRGHSPSAPKTIWLPRDAQTGEKRRWVPPGDVRHSTTSTSGDVRHPIDWCPPSGASHNYLGAASPSSSYSVSDEHVDRNRSDCKTQKHKQARVNLASRSGERRNENAVSKHEEESDFSRFCEFPPQQQSTHYRRPDPVRSRWADERASVDMVTGHRHRSDDKVKTSIHNYENCNIVPAPQSAREERTIRTDVATPLKATTSNLQHEERQRSKHYKHQHPSGPSQNARKETVISEKIPNQLGGSAKVTRDPQTRHVSRNECRPEQSAASAQNSNDVRQRKQNYQRLDLAGTNDAGIENDLNVHGLKWKTRSSRETPVSARTKQETDTSRIITGLNSSTSGYKNPPPKPPEHAVEKNRMFVKTFCSNAGVEDGEKDLVDLSRLKTDFDQTGDNDVLNRNYERVDNSEKYSEEELCRRMDREGSDNLPPSNNRTQIGAKAEEISHLQSDDISRSFQSNDQQTAKADLSSGSRLCMTNKNKLIVDQDVQIHHFSDQDPDILKCISLPGVQVDLNNTDTKPLTSRFSLKDELGTRTVNSDERDRYEIDEHFCNTERIPHQGHGDMESFPHQGDYDVESFPHQGDYDVESFPHQRNYDVESIPRQRHDHIEHIQRDKTEFVPHQRDDLIQPASYQNCNNTERNQPQRDDTTEGVAYERDDTTEGVAYERDGNTNNTGSASGRRKDDTCNTEGRSNQNEADSSAINAYVRDASREDSSTNSSRDAIDSGCHDNTENDAEIARCLHDSLVLERDEEDNARETTESSPEPPPEYFPTVDIPRPCAIRGLTERELSALSSSKLEKIPVTCKCEICWDPYKVGDKIRYLICAHYFHLTCIDIWLKRTATCPVCRTVLVDLFLPDVLLPQRRRRWIRRRRRGRRCVII